MIGNRLFYDIAAPGYKGLSSDKRIETGHFKGLLKDVVTAGHYAELMHFYAASASLGKRSFRFILFVTGSMPKSMYVIVQFVVPPIVVKSVARR